MQSYIWSIGADGDRRPGISTTHLDSEIYIHNISGYHKEPSGRVYCPQTGICGVLVGLWSNTRLFVGAGWVYVLGTFGASDIPCFILPYRHDLWLGVLIHWMESRKLWMESRKI